MLKFLDKHKDTCHSIFPISAHLSSTTIRQSISRLQTELVLKLVGVIYISTILKLDRVIFDLRKRNCDNGSRTRRRQLLDRFNVFSGVSLRFESVSEVAPLERDEERHKERDGRMPAPFRRHHCLRRRHQRLRRRRPRIRRRSKRPSRYGVRLCRLRKADGDRRHARRPSSIRRL